MKLWRLTRNPFAALDGVGAMKYGTRYAPLGYPVVSLASEAGLAVLIALRYQPSDLSEISNDFILGWTEIEATPERVPDGGDENSIRSFVGDWLDQSRSLLASVRSKVLPEADVVLMNPGHPDAALVMPLTSRPFSFAECLHTPPMLKHFKGSA